MSRPVGTSRRPPSLSRRPEAVVHRAGENTSVLADDVLDPSSHGAAFAGLRAACHLIHSTGDAGLLPAR
jgi:uncharacterized protein YbjT (DUF2867 family)